MFTGASAGKIRTTDITQLSGPKKTFHDIITVCYDYGLCLHFGMTVFLYKVPVIIRGGEELSEQGKDFLGFVKERLQISGSDKRIKQKTRRDFSARDTGS